jgi:hypothetical protein
MKMLALGHHDIPYQGASFAFKGKSFHGLACFCIPH